MTASQQIWLISCLRVQFARFTRLDVALDLPKGLIDYDKVIDSLESRGFKGVRKASCHKDWGGEFPGWSVTLGTRQSDRQVVLYDKYAESHGELICDRIELRVQDDKAQVLSEEMGKWMQGRDEEWARKLGEVVTGALDVRVREAGKVWSQLSFAGWWAAIIRMVGHGVFPAVTRIYRSLDSKRAWLQRQVLGTLEKVFCVFADNPTKLAVEWLYDGWSMNWSAKRWADVIRWKGELYAKNRAECGM
jgi:hypothetical protein